MKKEKLEEIEELISAGQSARARKLLEGLRVSKIPRNRMSTVANLCRRVGLAELALKILKSVVRSSNSQVKAKANEVVVYAQALSSIGGSEEAIRLLNNDYILQEEPKASLYLAFAYFAQWDYQTALVHLENFLNRIEKGTYIYYIGQVNCVAALVTLARYKEAKEFLEPLIQDLDSRKHTVLAGNCRELLAQVFFNQNKLEKASILLDQALELLGDQKYPDALFVKKWQALIDLKKDRTSKEARKKIEWIRNKAREIDHFETLRDVDYHTSLIDGDRELFNRVYFGSPFAAYRQKMKKSSKMPVDLSFRRNFSNLQAKKYIEINSLIEGPEALFAKGSLYHRLLYQLSLDFYRPIRIPTLFSKLYSDEFFEPESSSQKMKMLISRLRKIIAPLGLKIEEKSGKGYLLTADSKVGLIYRAIEKKPPSSRLHSRFKEICEHFSDQDFSCEDVSQFFDVSPRTAVRWLNEYCEQGMMEKIGVKKGVRYQVAIA